MDLQIKQIFYSSRAYYILLFNTLNKSLKNQQISHCSSSQITQLMVRQQKNTVFRLLRVYIGFLFVLTLFAVLKTVEKEPTLYEINHETHNLLHSLIKTKYFRMLRVNLNRECQLYVRNKICKSQSCTVCRCDQKDIPTNWIKTDKVQKQMGGNIDIWQRQRQQNASSLSWIWHVEDEQNDVGEYFDLDKNIESFTNYNGSTIWQMIYEDNCFNGRSSRYQNTCKEQQVFYKVISGLHTSVATHLSMFYKNASAEAQMWADLRSSEEFYVNFAEYRRRVLDHPQRVQNLLFIYQIYLRAIKEIAPYMLNNYTLHSQNILQDLQATQLLHNLSKKIDEYQFKPFDRELRTFFYPQNPKVKYYQRYIHNISRLMNCVECQKCRLFGKMQTYGIGTALKILLGYNNFYKRNEMVALFNAWNKISMSVEFYYKNMGPQQISKNKYDFFWVQLFGFVGGFFILFMYLLTKIDIQNKIRKLFKRVKFPSEHKPSVPSAPQKKGM